MVVDHNPELIEFITTHLSGQYQLIFASTPEEALEEYRRKYLQIRIVLMNLDLSALYGNSLISKMCTISHVPEIIVYSSKPINVAHAVQAVKLGAYSYLSSPFDLNELNRTIEDTLSRFDMSKKMEAMTEKQFHQHFDIATLLQLRKEWTAAISDVTHPQSVDTFMNELDYLSSFVDHHTKPLPKILVVEDEEIYRDLIIEFLDQEFTVIGVGNCRDALSAAEANPDIDIILLDVFLPDGSGTDILPQLHHMAPMSQTVIITAFEFVDIAVDSIRIGAVEYLNKPFKKDDLLQIIDQLLDARYENLILPRLTKLMMSETLLENEKYLLLERLMKLRSDSSRQIFMADIMFVFPELKSLGLPATLALPSHITATGIRNFVLQLKSDSAATT